MRFSRSSLLSCCVAAVLGGTAILAWAQSRKAGLWETTTTTTLQQSPFPNGMQPPADSPLAPGPRVTRVCLTQEMIGKFGAPVPTSRNDCSMANVQKGEHGMTADLICSGRVNGKGTVHSDWQDAEHATGGVHFAGTVQGRADQRPIEWTSQSTSVFKSADCGDVKPNPIPEGR